MIKTFIYKGKHDAKKKFIAGALLMGTLPYMSFAKATTESSDKAATKTKNGVVITNDNFIHADSIRAYLKELDKAGKVKYKILSDFALDPQPNVIKNGFDTMKERDPVAARTVIAIGWGALSGENAVYSSFVGNRERCSFTMEKPDLNYKEHGFFSFTIYNFDGYITTIDYAINSDSMEPNADGTYTVTFLASGEPVKEGEKNIVRTPRGKMWTGVLRNYYPHNNTDTLFAWADKQTAKMSKAFMK
jgi:hypothetical protein